VKIIKTRSQKHQFLISEETQTKEQNIKDKSFYDPKSRKLSEKTMFIYVKIVFVGCEKYEWVRMKSKIEWNYLNKKKKP
jgi:hypothetical protein